MGTTICALIGNQSYSEKIGPLKNPHNDIALVGAALEKVGFKVTRVEDAGYKAIASVVPFSQAPDALRVAHIRGGFARRRGIGNHYP